MTTIQVDIIINEFFQENYTEFWKQFFTIVADIWDKYWVFILALIFWLYFLKKKVL